MKDINEYYEKLVALYRNIYFGGDIEPPERMVIKPYDYDTYSVLKRVTRTIDGRDYTRLSVSSIRDFYSGCVV